MSTATITSPREVADRAAQITARERAQLAKAWRMQIGGGGAMKRVRLAAIAADRHEQLAGLRAAAQAAGKLEGESGEKAEYEAAQARQCVAEVILAVSMWDLADDAVDRRALELLVAPWIKVIGPIESTA